MHTKTYHILLVIVLFVLSSLLCAGCNSDNLSIRSGSTSPYTVWWNDPHEYNTNVLSIAQKQTPFSIVLPSYLPDDISPIPHFSGRALDEWDDDISLIVSYRNIKPGSEMIIIEEYNVIITVVPGEDSEYLMFGDTQVLERRDTALSMDENDQFIDVDAYYYSWNSNGIHFDVSISDYDNEEARNVVRSMIEDT